MSVGDLEMVFQARPPASPVPPAPEELRVGGMAACILGVTLRWSCR